MQSNDSNPTYSSKIAVDLVVALGESPTQTEVLCRCPLCGDSASDPSKKRFSVNIDSGKYYCHNCCRSGQSTDIAVLLLNLGVMFGSSNKNKKTFVKKPIKFELITIPVKKLPADIRQKVLFDLLRRRVFTKDQIFNLDYCMSGSKPSRWVGRVVIEVDKIKFGKSLDKTILPKYLTQPNFKLVDNGYININNIKNHSDPIILTEGLLDLLSLPADKAIMSPGISGLFNELSIKTSQKFPIIEVPDSDIAGVNAFLKIINRRLLEDPQSNLRFCFVYWINGKINSDINDLKMSGMSNNDIYDQLVKRSLPGTLCLEELCKSFPIIKEKKGWILRKEEVKTNVQTDDVNNKDRGSQGDSKGKKGISRTINKLSWF